MFNYQTITHLLILNWKTIKFKMQTDEIDQLSFFVKILIFN